MLENIKNRGFQVSGRARSQNMILGHEHPTYPTLAGYVCIFVFKYSIIMNKRLFVKLKEKVSKPINSLL